MTAVTNSLLKTYAESDALDLATLVRGGQVSPAELVEAAVRIDGPIATVASTMIAAITSHPWAPHDIARNV